MGPLTEDIGVRCFSVFDLCHYSANMEPEAFQPELAQAVYTDHLRQWQAAEALGFDGVFLTEHHFTAYNLLPSPNVMLAALAAQTQRIRIGTMINVLPFHQPFRLAEESAMVDLLSGGRLEFGAGRGVDYQEFVKLRMNFDETRARFKEAMELILRAWTQPVFSDAGTFYEIGEASLYPRPLQQPHPPVWVSSSSYETIDWTGSQGYGMGTIFVPTAGLAERYARFQDARQRAGFDESPLHYMLVRGVYVSEDAEEAFREAERAFLLRMALFENAALPPDVALLPDSYAYHRELFRRFKHLPDDFRQIVASGLVLCGTPSMVLEQLQAQLAVVPTRQIGLEFAFGDLQPDKVMRSMELFAKHVMPALREP